MAWRDGSRIFAYLDVLRLLFGSEGLGGGSF